MSSTKFILSELAAGSKPKTGSQIARVTCEPIDGLTTLTHQAEARAAKLGDA